MSGGLGLVGRGRVYLAMIWKRMVEKVGFERCELFMGVCKING